MAEYMYFKLRAGQHIDNDYGCQPSRDGKYPDKVYNSGDIVESTVDLAARFGHDKFERLAGAPKGFQRKQAEVAAKLGQQRPDTVEPGDTAEDIIRKNMAEAEAGTADKHAVAEANARAIEQERQRNAPEMRAGDDQPNTPNPEVKQTGADRPNFDQMSTKDLQEYARQNKIDLKGEIKRDKILAALRAK